MNIADNEEKKPPFDTEEVFKEARRQLSTLGSNSIERIKIRFNVLESLNAYIHAKSNDQTIIQSTEMIEKMISEIKDFVTFTEEYVFGKNDG